MKPGALEEQTKCKHQWQIYKGAEININGHLPALISCLKCGLILTFNDKIQFDTLEHIKNFEKKTAIIALIFSGIALLISILALLLK